MRHNGHVPIVGVSSQMRELRTKIERVAHSDANVLITGESGVGKEVVAREIHWASPRASQPFVPINCAGIPETLMESELFGHVKGSFTGAYRDRPGRLEMANGGTVFLDEVGEMSLRMQGLLLRFVETGELRKVGAERVSSVRNVRVIAATNRNLRHQISGGQFRQDLYYRLNVIHLAVPPLRERREDIPELVEHFIRRPMRHAYGGNGDDSDIDGRRMSSEALDVLCKYAWPGNVRELENVIERLLVISSDDVVDVNDIPPEIRGAGSKSVGQMGERHKSVADDLFNGWWRNRSPFGKRSTHCT